MTGPSGSSHASLFVDRVSRITYNPTGAICTDSKPQQCKIIYEDVYSVCKCRFVREKCSSLVYSHNCIDGDGDTSHTEKSKKSITKQCVYFLSEWNVDNNRNHTVCHGVVFVTTKWPSDDIYIYQHVFFIPPLLEWLNPDRAKSGYLASTNERT